MRKTLAAIALALCATAFAQTTNDADKQKLIDIEQKSAAITSFTSPRMTDFLQKYLYDGNTSSVQMFGHLYRYSKTDVVAFTKKPDTGDPDVKAIYQLSDFQVDIYGDTALVSYKEVETDNGHKLPVLNGDYHLTCLDTFLKRKGEWYFIGTSCAPSAPISQERWDANKQKEEISDQKTVPPSSPQ